MSNIITAEFGNSRAAKTRPIFEYNAKQILQFPDLDLPDVYEVHMCNEGDEETKTAIGNANGVQIYNEYLRTGRNVVAYIVLHAEPDSRETEYMAIIPIKYRPVDGDAPPDPEQEDYIGQLITELNNGVDRAEAAAEEAERQAGEAQRQAEEAERYVDEAAEEADRAERAASRAEDVKDDVIAAKNEAVAAAGRAVLAESNAAGSAILARGYAEQTARDKAAAENAADGAAVSAESAARSAASIEGDVEQAEEAARQAVAAKGGAEAARVAAETAKDGSVTAKQGAEAAATNAGNSASAAAQSAQAADASKTAAAGSASDASASASAASASATAASASATTASNAATAAQTAQSSAEDAAEDAQQAAQQAHVEYEQLSDAVDDLSDEVSQQKSAIEDLQALTNRKAGMLVDSVSGSIASFVPDATVPNLLGVTVDIEPVQDLHGYDNPWPGGGGKNLFQTTATTGTVNGTTFTVNDDGTIRVSGTPSAIINGGYVFGEVTLPAGTYKVNGNDFPTNALRITVYNVTASTSLASIYNGYDISFTLSEESVIRVYPFVHTDFNGTATTLKPMIRLASVTDATYAPYENICPISGWDSVEAQTTGVNILPFPYAETSLTRFGITYTVNDDGTITANGTATNDSWFVLSNAWPYTADRITGRTIRLSGCPAGGSTSTFFIRSVVTGHNDVGSGVSINSFRAGYFRFQISIKSGTTVNNLVFKPMVVFGSSVLPYHPYAGNRYTIALDQTVYGGTLTIAEDGSVNALVDRAMVDLGTLSWIKADAWMFRTTINAMLFQSLPLCSAYKGVVVTGTSQIQNGEIASTNSQALNLIRIRDYQKWQTMDASAFQASVSNVQFVYELATPFTITLDPVTISTIANQTNNVWADAGDVSVEFAADLKTYIDQKLSALAAQIVNS